MLDKLINGRRMYKDEKKTQRVLNELENIDDKCDQLEIVFVKTRTGEEAEEYVIEKIWSLVLFQNKIPPILYKGNLEK